MPGHDEIRTMIEQIARGLVDRPEEVAVEPVEEPRELVFELTVAEDDLGRVIGRQGRTARALRNLLAAAGRNAEKPFVLEILE
ncbi:MAG: KH domain-containing protein [Acidobacteriales bacterium]|nr:KH domain-containing protein [Terriglobales bacterium]